MPKTLTDLFDVPFKHHYGLSSDKGVTVGNKDDEEARKRDIMKMSFKKKSLN